VEEESVAYDLSLNKKGGGKNTRTVAKRARNEKGAKDQEDNSLESADQNCKWDREGGGREGRFMGRTIRSEPKQKG